MPFKKLITEGEVTPKSEEPSAVPAPTSSGSSPAEGSAVDHPKHYNSHPSGIECIEVVRHMPFNIGSAVKYLWRAGLKDGAPTVEDYEKAIWYIQDQIKMLKGEI